jgi:PAS domain S-box-containing protein
MSVPESKKTKSSEIQNEPIIETVAASFNNFPSERPIENAVIYFWESHTNNPDDRKKIQATIDLIYRRFDVNTCENYEIRSGYLSRYNYLQKQKNECSIEDLENAILKGYEEQEEWVARCSPKLPGFVVKNWQECTPPERNPHFIKCRDMLANCVDNDEEFSQAFSKSVADYGAKKNANPFNSKLYLIEENAWILTLPLLHPGKQIFIIHVGNVTDSTSILFSRFQYLKDSSMLLLPNLWKERFGSMEDFSIERSNKKFYGFSHPSDDDTIHKLITYGNCEKKYDNNELLKMLLNEQAEKERLSAVLSSAPFHVYWMDLNGNYISCNELQAKHFGLNSVNELAGKTVYDFWKSEEARKHDNVNKKVFKKGVQYSGEEFSVLRNGELRYSLSFKNPIFNKEKNKIIGLFGFSVDITGRKKAENLKKQIVEIEMRAKFRKTMEKLSYDITSPLAILNSIEKDGVGFSDAQLINLQNSITSIQNISDAMLAECTNKISIDSERAYPVLITQLLDELVARKKLECKDNDVDFQYLCDASLNFTFVEVDFLSFNRIMSNLINNAVDALERKSGAVKVSLGVKNQSVVITVEDNGVGMDKEAIAKILNNEKLYSTKCSSRELCMNNVKNTVDFYKGKMDILSKEKVGTEIILTFPQAESPAYMINKVVLKKGTVVVILDYDTAARDVWRKRLKSHMNDLDVKFFNHEDSAYDFINSYPEKNRIFLFSEYRLSKEKNGLCLILENEMDNNSIIVTNIYEKAVNEVMAISNVKAFPKQFIDYINISVVS